MNELNPKVSVIVPVYKAEAYLHRCVDSLLAQTFQDYEILLIDDGSPDRSGEICDEYAKMDKRIRVFHKENGGVSSARNIGLDNAQGEWVAFVDADDWVDRDYLFLDEKYNDVDVIEKSYSILNEDLSLIGIRKFQNVLLGKSKLFYYYVNKRTNALWNKLISRKVIASTRFDTAVSIGEDFLFFLNLLPSIQKYAFSSIGTYFYVIHPHSAMQTVLKKTHNRLAVLWQNIDNVKKITEEEHLYYLQCAIIYGTYLVLLCNFRQYMSVEEKKKISLMFKQMKCRDLKLLSFRKRIDLMVKKINYQLKFIQEIK